MALNNYIVLVSSSVGSLAVNIACASAAVRYTGNNLMKWRWILLFAFAGQVNTFYLFIMPRLITLRSQDALGGMGLTVVRIFVHPIVWSIVLFYFRIVQRHIGRVKDLTQTCFLVWPVLYSSLYGRFLLLQLGKWELKRWEKQKTSLFSIPRRTVIEYAKFIASLMNDRAYTPFFPANDLKRALVQLSS